MVGDRISFSTFAVRFSELFIFTANITQLIKINTSDGIAFNLGLLAYFKYRNFLIENIELLFIGSSHSFEKFSAILIPLGISFYTFQQIAMLIDAKDGTIKTSPPFLHFVQFITFFPS